MSNVARLYETDYDAWLQGNLELLRQSRFDELDVKHLIEEMEDMGRKERGELSSRMVILVAHLLKWQFQPPHRSSSWRGSIAEQRIKLVRRLHLSPSLKPFLPEAISDAYEDAVELAVDETGLEPTVFPQTCPYTAEQLLDRAFWPDNLSETGG
jgi:hypothetical protein